MLDTSSVLTTEYMCYGCENLVSINMHDNNFNSVISMEAMFSKCTNLVYMDTVYMSTTSNLTNLFAMFNECSSLNDVYLGNINTTNVTNMSYMFSYCQKLEKVMFYSPIDSVQEIYGMFYGITTNGTLYYNSSYDYSKMIAELPSTWTTSNEI
jgi:surface protein